MKATAARARPWSSPPTPITGVSRRRIATDPAMTAPIRPPMPMAPMMSPAPDSPAPRTSSENEMPRMSSAPPMTNRVAITSRSASAPHSPQSSPSPLIAETHVVAVPSDGGAGAARPNPRHRRVATVASTVARRKTNQVPTSCVPTPATIGPRKYDSPSETDDRELADTRAPGVSASCGREAKYSGRTTAIAVSVAVAPATTSQNGAPARSAIVVPSAVTATAPCARTSAVPRDSWSARLTMMGESSAAGTSSMTATTPARVAPPSA